MELSWNLCPYCGTPSPGKRRENLTLDDIIEETPLYEEIPPEDSEGLDEFLEGDSLNTNDVP